MNNRIDQLIIKYIDAETSLKEEREIEHYVNTDEGKHSYPEIWAQFNYYSEKKAANKSKLPKYFLSAASILLFVIASIMLTPSSTKIFSTNDQLSTIYLDDGTKVQPDF